MSETARLTLFWSSWLTMIGIAYWPVISRCVRFF